MLKWKVKITNKASLRQKPRVDEDGHPDTPAPHEHWKQPISAALLIETDWSVLVSIKEG